MAYENIIVGTRGRVGMITLNRPKALNALNDALMNELGEALAKFDADEGIGAIVIAGGDKAFAAGADIGAMKDRGYRDVYMGEFVTRNWERMKSVRKPVIAAVAGYALGGGCELAMMCDIVIAAEGARFGQPRLRVAARRRDALRAAAVPRALRDRGPEGRHGGVRGETQAQLQAQMSGPHPNPLPQAGEGTFR